jgi:hypothetical protein
MKTHPVEVYDQLHGCCYVNTKEQRTLVRRSSKRITYGKSYGVKFGEIEDVLLDGEKIGIRFSAYE